jgi:PAS domain S-box-containing protein
LARDIEAAVAALSSDQALSGAIGPDAVILAWNAGGDQIIWASDAAAALRSAIADVDGKVSAQLPAAGRLRALAGGIAPRAGLHLERLRLANDPLQPPATVLCRTLDLEDGPVLVTILPPPAKRRGDPGALRLVTGPRPGPDAQGTGPGEATGGLPEPRSPLLERLRRQGSRRFIWSMDPEGRFTAVSDALAETIGRESASILGRRWDELVGEVLLDETGTVAACIARRATWSHETVLWRVHDTTCVVPVDLGGMPIFDRAHAHEGFRGFGLCRAGDARFAPEPAIRRPAAPPSAAPPPAGAGRFEPPPESIQNAASSEMPAGGNDQSQGEIELARGNEDAHFGELQAQVGAQLGAARAVPLRALGTEDESVTGAPGDPQAAAATEPRPLLSMSERGALREIARALGARLESDEEEEGDPAEPRASADILTMPTRPREGDPSRVFDRLPVGIVVLRGEAPLYANRFVLDLLGYGDIAELNARGGVGRLFAGRLDKRQQAGGSPNPLTLVARTGKNLPVDVRLTTVEWGEQPASLLMVRPLRDEEAGPSARSLELEVGLRDSRIRELTAVLDLAELGAATLDEAGRILSLNRGAELMFGYDENEVAGELVTALIATESHLEAVELLGRAAAGPPGRPSEARDLFGRQRHGDALPLSVSAARLEGGGAFLVVLFRDLSGARAREAELKAARRAAETATARQSEFLARVSHEIRTPLNAIIGFAELMLEERFGAVGSERYKLYLQDIRRSGEHVVSLVNDLLDLAKIASGKTELTLVSLDLNGAVRDSVGIMGAAALRDRVVLRTKLADNLPQIVADERSLKQIALNLLSNAIRFNGSGGQVIVSTGLTDRGEVALRVRDTGTGMSEDDVAAALEPFRQISMDRKAGGTGLGLPLAKAMAEANGASFAISSRRGEGTLIEIVFPAAAAAGPAQP